MLVATATTFTDPHRTFEAKILVDGQPLGIAPAKEGWYTLESLRGKFFSLDVQNLTNTRIEVVVAIDHRNVLNATQGAVPEEMLGLVIEPGKSHSFKGWRTCDKFAAQFAFNIDPCKTGVIGIGVFREACRRPRTTYLKDVPNQKVHSGRVDNLDVPETEAPFVLEAVSLVPSLVAHTIFTRQPGSFSAANLYYRNLEASGISDPPPAFLSSGPRSCLAAPPDIL